MYLPHLTGKIMDLLIVIMTTPDVMHYDIYNCIIKQLVTILYCTLYRNNLYRNT